MEPSHNVPLVLQGQDGELTLCYSGSIFSPPAADLGVPPADGAAGNPDWELPKPPAPAFVDMFNPISWGLK